MVMLIQIKNLKLLSNNKNFYSKSDGVAYFEDKSNRCEIDSLLLVFFLEI